MCEDCDTQFQPEHAPRTHRIFLSYGHDENRVVVDRLRDDLSARGHEVWMDTTRIKTGDDWRREITDGLLTSSAVLGFLSAHSVRNPGVCLDELRIALSTRSAHIQTVLLESIDDVSPPSTVASIQWLDMSDWREYHQRGGEEWEAWYRRHLEELCEVLESEEARALEGEVTLLRRLLSPAIAESKERALAESYYSDRPWLDAQVESWRADGAAPRTLVLTGGPGSGKSMFAAHLLHYNPHAICGVFCEWDRSATIEPKRVVDLIAFKLACKLPDYRRGLLEQLTSLQSEALESLTDGDYLEALLIAPLRRTIDGERERLFIVVDGLDEATTDHRNALAETLALHVPRLPPWLGVVVTTRPEQPVIQPLAGERSLHLDDETSSTHDDVLRYVANSLQAELSAVPRRVTTLDAIARNAGASFLYATMFIEGVRDGTLKLDAVDTYPTGLDAFYHRNLQRRFGESERFRPWRRVLEVLCAFQATPVEVITASLDLSPYDITEFVDAFGSLVRRNEMVVGEGKAQDALSFSHKSIVDWLRDPKRSGRFHADPRKGAASVARLARRTLGDPTTESPPRLGEAALAFLQAELGGAHARAGQLEELEAFLLDPGTPISPCFESLSAFPDGWDLDPLLSCLWAHPDRQAFLTSLQRRGEQRQLGLILDGFARLHGLSAMPPDTVNMLIDIVHLGGGYREAVELCDNYLASLDPQEVTSEPELARIATRRLHHSMFFAPVRPLIADALGLIHDFDPDAAPGVYNELLFLVGGNLGVLQGDFAFAEIWLLRALEFAGSRGNHDHRTRALRKLAEVYLATERVEDAVTLLHREVEVGQPIRGRYELYLTATLGEASRLRRDTVVARRCFEQVRDVAASLGIPGWKAHGELGMAMLLADLSLDDEALSYLRDAIDTYERIDQAWGRITASICSLRFPSAGSDLAPPFPTEGELARETSRLGYRYLHGLVSSDRTGTPADLCLQFL